MLLVIPNEHKPLVQYIDSDVIMIVFTRDII